MLSVQTTQMCHFNVEHFRCIIYKNIKLNPKLNFERCLENGKR